MAVYAVWICASLWIIGGLMERRISHVVAESVRLVLTAAGVTWTGSWFGPVALSGVVQACIAFAAGLSLLALWAVFKPSPTGHGYFSRQ